MNRNEIKQLLEPYDHPDLECDGATRVFSWLLCEQGVPHTIKFGRLEVGRECITPHYWIELDNGLIVDYKARMWLPECDAVPHGVFDLSEYPQALYIGEEAVGFMVSQTMFNILVRNPTIR